jgi:hypothetical protein
MNPTAGTTDYKFLELVWPGKGGVTSVSQRTDGTWDLRADPPTSDRIHPLVGLYNYPPNAQPSRSIVIRGQRLQALTSLDRALGRFVRLAYLDLPRIGVDDARAGFQGDPGIAFSSWLSVVRAHMQAVEPLLRRDGVVVLHAGDNEAAYARLLGNEMFRGQHIGTVVWQRAYAPRNMPGMKDFTATHDCLIVFAKDKAAIPPVGLRRAPEGFSNPDGDPRGPWKAEHKGAKTRRENSDFNTYVPPYRWRIVDGKLPNGLWRLAPLTGVIWGVPEEIGRFPITVEASDSTGAATRHKYEIEILETGQQPKGPDLPWIFEEAKNGGKIKIVTKTLPTGVLGQNYMAGCLAEGGVPFKAEPKRPGSGRYWEFARDTLLEAYQNDAIYLGRDEPTSIPHPKQYAPPEGQLVVENQQTWWPGRTPVGSKTVAVAGYTEDATKHLKAMKELGLITTEASSAKPEHLLARLIDIFTEPDDAALEVLGSTGDLAAVALKRGRSFVCLSGASSRDDELCDGCTLPRLRAIVDGKDQRIEEQLSEIRMRPDAYIPYGGGGAFATAKIGEWIFERYRTEELTNLNWSAYPASPDLIEAVLTAEGFLPIPGQPSTGISMDGRGLARIVAPEDFLTTELASEIATQMISSNQKATIYYFRASLDFDATLLPTSIACKRIPFDLGV